MISIFTVSFFPGMYLAVCALVAFGFVFSKVTFAVRLVCFAIGLLTLGALPRILSITFLGDYRCPWIFHHILVGVPFIALVVSAIRWLDFRLVSLSQAVDDMQIERTTGKSLDGWLHYFNAQEGSTWTPGTIVARLRTFGVQNADAIQVARSVMIASGRYDVERTDTNDRLRVSSISAGPRFGTLLEQQSSLRQWMLGSVCIAFWSMALRWSSGTTPNILELSIVLGLAGGISIHAISLPMILLSMHKTRWKSWLMWLLAVVSYCYALRLTGWESFVKANSFQVIPFFIFCAVMSSAPFLALAMMLLRQKGFRFAYLRRYKPQLDSKGTHHFIDNPTSQTTHHSEFALRRQKRGG
jgi:hypothetical protein